MEHTASEGRKGRMAGIGVGIVEASKSLLDKMTKTAALSFVFLFAGLAIFNQYQMISDTQLYAQIGTFVMSVLLAYATTEQDKWELRYILGTISLLLMSAFTYLLFNLI